MQCIRTSSVTGLYISLIYKCQKISLKMQHIIYLQCGVQMQTVVHLFVHTLQSKLLEVQCKVSTVCDDLGSDVICWCHLCFLKTKATAPVYQEILEHFMLPSADQLFKDADFIFQQDLAPAHTAKIWLNTLESFHTTSAVPQTDHLHATPN